MDIYGALLDTVTTEYDTVSRLKDGPRGSVSVVRHRGSGARYVFRCYEGSGAVYRRLLPVVCAQLPQIMEVGVREGRTAVLEEYVRGDTLAAVLGGGPLTAAQARGIAAQLCSALWVLHSMGIIHRDLKPENVILRGDEAVLIDFDAARLYRNGGGNDTQILGTTGFAAPEQYGITQTDERADIYSLGVLLNIMLTGRHPSRGLASGRLGRIVQKCTMTAPEKRYQNVLSLMEAL